MVHLVCGLEPAFDARESIFNPDEPARLFSGVALFGHGLTANPERILFKIKFEHSRVFPELIKKLTRNSLGRSSYWIGA
jgi:hypothetical protein